MPTKSISVSHMTCPLLVDTNIAILLIIIVVGVGKERRIKLIHGETYQKVAAPVTRTTLLGDCLVPCPRTLGGEHHWHAISWGDPINSGLARWLLTVVRIDAVAESEREERNPPVGDPVSKHQIDD